MTPDRDIEKILNELGVVTRPVLPVSQPKPQPDPRTEPRRGIWYTDGDIPF